MLKRFWWGTGVLMIAGAAVLLLPQTSAAQRRSGFGGLGNYGGFGSSGFYGFGTGLGGYGAPSMGYGFPGGNYGYGLGNFGHYGYGNYGMSGYGNYGYGGFTPNYVHPNYGYGYNMMPSNQAFYAPQAASQNSPNEVHLMVVVPNPEAQITIDGRQTRQKGFEREFVSEMKPGTSGTYHIKARWTRDGQSHEETRNVRVRPGQWQVVDFTRQQGTNNTSPNERLQTPNPGEANGGQTRPADNGLNTDNNFRNPRNNNQNPGNNLPNPRNNKQNPENPLP